MIKRAMILAAGLGTRMRPLTDKIPKPLIKISGKALIDYKLDAIRRVKINTAIVNVHYLADQLEAHLVDCGRPHIIISNEREKLLESGGGIQKALHNFGTEPFFVLNSDAFWIEDKLPSLLQLYQHWDENKMDMLLGLADKNHVTGFHGAGDFFLDSSLHLKRRGTAQTAPYAFCGDYIVHPRIFRNLPREAFSSNLLFDRAIGEKRLCGVNLQGKWLHVGTPLAVTDAERAMKHSSKKAVRNLL